LLCAEGKRKADKRGILPGRDILFAGLSSFMQNIGAAALFVSVISRISDKTGLALSRLLIPIGFCAILDGQSSPPNSAALPVGRCCWRYCSLWLC
jgi:Na+/H+ antiporter NhaD/arsenite permease-like protein